MKKYKILPQYIEKWGDCTTETIVTDTDILELAKTWSVSVDELLTQLIAV